MLRISSVVIIASGHLRPLLAELAHFLLAAMRVAGVVSWRHDDRREGQFAERVPYPGLLRLAYSGARVLPLQYVDVFGRELEVRASTQIIVWAEL
jgi:hypothetical protein